MLESFEKVPVKIYKNVAEGSHAVAVQIAQLIRENIIFKHMFDDTKQSIMLYKIIYLK